MESYINPKNAQVISIKGDIHIDLTKNSFLQVGDVIKAGAVLNFEAGSDLILAFSDGSQHRLYIDERGTKDEIRSEEISSSSGSANSIDINNIQSEISAIQESIESDTDVELPETVAGSNANEGTSFVTVNRTGDETLAQAGYDTAEQSNISLSPDDFEGIENAEQQRLADEVDDEIDDEIDDETENLSDPDESVTTAEDTPVSGNVLDNASTADGPLTITSFTVGGNTYNAGDTVNLAEGELTLNADGSYTFTPAADYNGPVPVITYTVLDGAGDTDISTLTIAITPSSDLTDGDESVTTAEDTLVSGNVLDNASTADGPLTITSFTVGGNTYNAGDTVNLAEG
ncbi:MAG: retention module-containing protein, partial [Cognaticolwellia sp.]